MDTQIIELNRANKSVPWGFSIQGGKEFGCPLSVLRVSAGSIAEQLGVTTGDILIKINNLPTETMTHQQAIIQIQNLNVILEIKGSKTVNKPVVFPSPPPPVDDNVNFNNNCRISTSIGELPPPPPEHVSVMQPPYTSFPPPPPMVSNLPRPGEVQKPKHIPQENITAPTTRSNYLEKEKFKNDGGNMGSGSSTPLGKFIQNQSNNPNRDARDLVIQQINKEKSTAICCVCKDHIKGSFIEANKKIYCSDHFCCSFCHQPIKSTQFIETKEGVLYCMEDFTNHIVPKCNKCGEPVVNEQVMAMGKCWHSGCFVCHHCSKPIPQGNFHVKEDDGVISIFCEKDYKEIYEIKCSECNFAIEDDDKYMIVSGKNYHVHCFKR